MIALNRSILILSLVLVATTVRSDDDERPPNNSWEIEYTLNARLRLSDTMFGAGNGDHDIGPGKVVLRFEDVGGQPGGVVRVMSYEMANRFTVDARAFGFRTTVQADTTTRGTGNRCGVVTSGSLGTDRTIRWHGPWNVRTDGRLVCSGTCGSFGAPPRGQSDMHLAPHPVAFRSFNFAPSKKTFHMDYAVVNKTSVDTTSLVLFGRETRRTYRYVPPCA